MECEKDFILSPPKDVRQHGATVVIDGMPQPPRLRFLADITPHLIELWRQPAALCKLVSATDLNRDMLWGQVLQHRVVYLF
jgi:hypothetical protein